MKLKIELKDRIRREIFMKRENPNISEEEIQKILEVSEQWCAYKGSGWVEYNEDLLDYDCHIRAILWDRESTELVAIGYVAVKREAEDDFMIEDDWFMIELYEDIKTQEIDAHGQMDGGVVDEKWVIAFKSEKKPSWLNEDEDLKIRTSEIK